LSLSPKPYPHKCTEAGARTRDLPITDGRLYRCTRPALLGFIIWKRRKLLLAWDWEGAKVQKDHFIPTSTIEQLDDEHEGQGDAPNQDGSGSSSDSSPSASEQTSTPIRLKSLAEIYESCNFSVIEP